MIDIEAIRKRARTDKAPQFIPGAQAMQDRADLLDYLADAYVSGYLEGQVDFEAGVITDNPPIPPKYRPVRRQAASA